MTKVRDVGTENRTRVSTGTGWDIPAFCGILTTRRYPTSVSGPIVLSAVLHRVAGCYSGFISCDAFIWGLTKRLSSLYLETSDFMSIPQQYASCSTLLKEENWHWLQEYSHNKVIRIDSLAAAWMRVTACIENKLCNPRNVASHSKRSVLQLDSRTPSPICGMLRYWCTPGWCGKSCRCGYRESNSGLRRN